MTATFVIVATPPLSVGPDGCVFVGLTKICSCPPASCGSLYVGPMAVVSIVIVVVPETSPPHIWIMGSAAPLSVVDVGTTNFAAFAPLLASQVNGWSALPPWTFA